VAGFVDVQVFTKANSGWNTIYAKKSYLLKT
jgi:hypothetical protein